jgi:hypothetical protein
LPILCGVRKINELISEPKEWEAKLAFYNSKELDAIAKERLKHSEKAMQRIGATNYNQL